MRTQRSSSTVPAGIKHLVVKVTGAAGRVFPPELGGKEPLYPKGTTLRKEQAPGSLSLLWEGIWGLPYGFPSACVLVASSLPGLGTLEHGAFGIEQPKPARLYGTGWRRMGELQGAPSFPTLQEIFLGMDWPC